MPGILSKKLHFYKTVLILLTFFAQSRAQEIPPLVNFPSSAYKAHNQNWAIDQSSDHIMYAANSDGLLEFDGSSWKLYKLPDGQIVRTVLCDDKTEHRVYVGAYGEFGYWKRQADGQLQYFSLSRTANFASLKTEEIWHILKTPRYIYFQSFSFIYRYDGEKLTELKAPGNFMFLRLVQNRLLLQMIGKGIYELKGEKFEPLPGTEMLSTAIVSSMLPFSKSGILVTTSKHGLFLWEKGFLSPWKIPLSAELKRNIINRAIILSRDSSFAFGTIQNGIYVISKRGSLQYQFNKESGLQNNTVLALKEDSRQQLWTGLDQGIDLLKMSSPLLLYQTSGNPLGSTYAAAIWRNRLYVGSNKGVFSKRWPSTESFRPIHGLEGQTWFLKVFNDQLLCGHNDATYRISESGITRISDITGGWAMLPVKVGIDTLLLQGSYNGLHVYKKNQKNRWAYAYAVKGVPPIPIRQVVEDRAGRFWLGHAYQGLFRTRLTPQLDSALLWKHYKAPNDIPSEFAIEITKWNNKLRIKSGNAFLQPDSSAKLRPSLDFAHSEEDAFKIRPGSDGDWFKVFMNRVTYYAADNRNQNLELTLIRNSETIIPLTSEYYFFCLDNGYALYNRRSQRNVQQEETKPLIRKMANLRNLSETFAVTGNPVLPAAVRSIRILFSTPSYGQNIQYSYRLKGLADQWSEWMDQSGAEFTNLESGNYIFEVRNTRNTSVTAYSFSIKPYWSETLFARVLMTTFIILSVIVLVIVQERRLIRHRRKLLEEQEEKLRQQRLTSERQIMQIQNEKLHGEIQSKSQQLSNVAINVVRKNEILEEIRDELKQVKAEMGQQFPMIHYQKLLHSIERNVAGKEDWLLFEENFNEVHEQFFKKLRTICPGISPSELRLAACLRMNLSSKEMAPVLGISVRGVEIKRYRLRKKLELGMEANLVQFMMDV